MPSQISVTLPDPSYPGQDLPIVVRILPALGLMTSKARVTLRCEAFEADCVVSLRNSENGRAKVKAGQAAGTFDVTVLCDNNTCAPPGTLKLRVLALPTVSFPRPPIEAATDPTIPVVPGEYTFRIGAGVLHLALSAAAPPGGAVVDVAGGCLDKAYKVRFQAGSTTADQAVQLVDTSGLPRDVTLTPASGCVLASTPPALAVKVSGPRLSFPDTLTSLQLVAGQKQTVRPQLSYQAPQRVRGKISGPGLKEEVEFSIAKNKTEAIVELTGGDRLGEFAVNLEALEGASAGTKYRVDSTVAAPPLIMRIAQTQTALAALKKGSNYAVSVREKITVHVKSDKKPLQPDGLPAKLQYTNTNFSDENKTIDFTIKETEVDVEVQMGSKVGPCTITLAAGAGYTVEPNRTIAIDLQTVTMAGIAPGDDWIDPPAPHRVNDDVRFKLVLSGDPPTAPVQATLSCEAFLRDQAVTITSDEWRTGEKIVPMKLAKTTRIGNPTLRLRPADTTKCQPGRLMERSFPVGNPITIEFESFSTMVWTEPNAPIHRGGTFKLRVEVSEALTTEDAVAYIVADSLEPHAETNRNAYPVKFASGERTADVEVKINKGFKKTSTRRERSTFTLELPTGSKFSMGGDAVVDLDIEPLPILEIDSSQPGLANVTKQETKYQVSIGDTLSVRVKADRPPAGADGVAGKLQCVTKKQGSADQTQTVDFTLKDAVFVDVPVQFSNEGTVTVTVVIGDGYNTKPSSKIEFIAARTTTIGLHPSDEWFTPAAPHRINDELTFKLALAGDAPDASLVANLSSDAWDGDIAVTCNRNDWAGGEKVSQAIKLTKTTRIGDPSVRLRLPTGSTAKPGRVVEKKLPVGKARAIEFDTFSVRRWTDPDVPLYRGDTFKLRVEVTEAFTAETSVAFIASTALAARVEVKFPPDVRSIDVPVTINKTYNATATSEEAVPFTLELPEGSKVVLDSDRRVDVKISPFPQLYIAQGQPALSEIEQADGKYLFNIGEEATVRVKLTAKPPQAGSTGRLTGAALAQPVDLRFEGDTLIQDVKVTFANATREVIAVEKVDGCLIDKKKEMQLTVSNRATVSIAKTDDWVDPPAPRYKEDVKIKVLLLGRPSLSPTEVGLSSDAWNDTKTFALTEAHWTAGFAMAGPFTLEKTTTIGSPKVKIESVRNCNLGRLIEKTLAVGPARTFYFNTFSIGRWTEPAGPFYRNEKFKVRLELSEAATAKKNLAVIKCAGLTDVTVEFDAGERQKDVEITIPPAFKESEKTVSVDVTLTVEEFKENGKVVNGFYPGNDIRVTFRLQPDPAITLHSSTPLKNGKKNASTGIYEFRITEKAVLKVELSGRAPQDGAKFEVASHALGPPVNERPKAIAFELKGDERAKEIEVELLRDSGIKTSETIALVPKSGCRAGANLLVAVHVQDGALNFAEADWIKPKLDTYAPFDNCWFRVTRTFAEDKRLGASVTIKSPIFVGERIVAAFEAGQTVSLPVIGRIKKDLRPSAPFRAYTVEIEPTGAYELGPNGKREIKVSPKRLLYFAPGQFGDEAKFVFGQWVRFAVNLSVPARTDTWFQLSCKGFKNHVYAHIPKGQMTKTVQAQFAVQTDDETLDVELAIYRLPGKLQNAGLAANDSEHPAVLNLNVHVPRLAFKKDEPFKTPVQTESNVAGVVGVGTKAKLNVVLDEPPPVGAEATMTSPAFGSKVYDIVFPKNQQVAEVEVEFTRANERPVEIALHGKKWCKPDESGTKPPSRIVVRVAPLPSVRFPYPPLPTAQAQEEAIGSLALLFGEEPQTPAPIIEDAERGDWIEPNGFPFVVGDKAKVTVCLTQAAPERGASAILICPAFGRDYPIQFASGEKKKVIEVEFTNAAESPNQTVTLRAADRCILGTEFCRLVQVFRDRPVFFPARRAMLPAGPFIPGDTALVSVRLKTPAPPAKVTATLSGPFADVNVEFAPGQTRRDVRVTFTRESADEQQITLKKGNGCVLGERVTRRVRVLLPEIGFDDPIVPEGTRVHPGAEVYLRLKLKNPAPILGCSVIVASEAFANNKSYKVTFPLGDTTAGAFVRLREDIAFPSATAVEVEQTITLKTAKRCKLPSVAETKLKVSTSPRIRFDLEKKKATQEAEYEAGQEISLFIVPSEAPASNLEVKVKSTAFSGRVYIANLPARQVTPTELKVTLSRAVPLVGGLAQPQEIKLIAPHNWQASPVKDEADQEAATPNGHTILVKVKPKATAAVQSCPLAPHPPEEEHITAEAPEPEVEEMPDLDAPCNLHRLLLTVKHGKTTADGKVERGPKKDGTFEVVFHKDLAENPDQALVCTPDKTPILQVIGGREFGDPHVDEPEESFHYTVIGIKLDDKDTYCNQQFIHPDRQPLQHPILFVRDRVKGELGKIEAKIAKAAAAASRQVERAQAALESAEEATTGRVTAAKKKVDDYALNKKKDLFEPVEHARQAVLTRVGNALGLEVEADEEEEEEGGEGEGESSTPKKPKRTWSQRYKWQETFTPPSLRPKLDEDSSEAAEEAEGEEEGEGEDEEKFLHEMPVHQAHQVWHETVEPEPEENESIVDGVVSHLINTGEEEEEDEDAKEQGTGLIRDLISALSFAKMAPKQYEVVVETCGVPDTTGENVDSHLTPKLRAIVEVYPSDEFCLHYEYNAGVDPVRFGASGTFYDPSKGDGEDGLKSEEEGEGEEGAEGEAADGEGEGAEGEGAEGAEGEAAEGEAAEEEEEEEERPASRSAFSFRLIPDEEDDDEEEEEEEDEEEDEDEDISIEMPEVEESALIQVPAPTPPRDFIYRGHVIPPIPEESSPRQPGEPSPPSLVFHKWGDDEDEEEEDESFLDQALQHLEDAGAYELGTKNRPIVEGEVDLDILTDGSVSAVQEALDNSIFSVTDLGITLNRNGKTGPFYLEITKTISGSIQTIRAIVAVFEAISASCNVSFGWGVQFKVEFLQGNVNLYWGWKEFEDHRVFKWMSLQADLMLIKISASVNVGFSASVLFMKFQAIVYGKLSIEASLDNVTFERTTPDSVYPEWLDTWLTFAGKAELGASLILVHENVFQVNAAIKTGYEFKVRITPGLTDKFGMEYQIFWLGVTASATFKLVCFKEKQGTITIIEGSPKELPWKRGTFPKRASTSWWNVKQILNIGWSRVIYQETRTLAAIQAYQELQLYMVTHSTKRPPDSGLPYTEELPGPSYTGSPDDTEAKRTWEQNKAKWDRQWDECKDAFNWERHKATSRTLHRSFDLNTRLNSKNADIERKVQQLLPVVETYAGLKAKILAMNETIFEAEQNADEGQAASAELLREVRELAEDPQIRAADRRSKPLISEIQDLLKDLKHYADQRREW